MTAIRAISSTAADLRAGRLSSSQLLEECLQVADDGLGVFATRWTATARAAAAAADELFARGVHRGPLQGVPLAVKDLISAAESPATGGSRLLGPAWGTGHGDAVCVARVRAAGAVLVGATVTSEFGLGAPVQGSGLPVPRNPWDRDRGTGGSSSGSASAVLTGMALGALGTDSGGSVRMPAAFCGVTGLKPTADRVPIRGVLPLGWSTDTVGVLGGSAEDCSTLFAAIADPLPAPVVPTPDDAGLAGLVIGIDRLDRFGAGFVDGAWPERWADLLSVLTAAGAEVTDVVLPFYDEVATASTVITLSEALAGHRPTLGPHWAEHLPDTRATLALAASFSGADLVQAQRVRAAGRRAVRALFDSVDVVLTPTAAMTATPFSRLPDMFASGEFAAVHALYWNALGNPALSVPVGPGGDGLPLAVQLVGPSGGDERVLAVAADLQRRTSWHLRRPAPTTTGASTRRSAQEKEFPPCPKPA